MPTVNVKANICNLALGRLGSYGSVENIDSPNKAIERTFAKWWDLSRQSALKIIKPNFAIAREILAVSAETPKFGNTYQYVYPTYCLSLLGVGNIQDKTNNYTVEDGYIRTEEGSTSGLEIRYIKDATDVGTFSSEFVEALSWVLAANVCMEVTGDTNKQAFMSSMVDKFRIEAASLNAQENIPIRINHSKFQESKYYTPSKTDKY